MVSGQRSEDHTSELQSLPTRRSSDLDVSVLSRFRGSFAHDGTMRRSASLHRTLQTACCSSEEENLLDCEEPRRYGRRASRLLCSVPMSSRLKWFLAKDRKTTRLNSSHSLHDALPI